MGTFTINFWNLIAFIAVCGFLPLIGVFLGAWAVFRTKNAQLGIPFMEKPEFFNKDKGPASYVSDLFAGEREEAESILEERDLSSAASRLRGQKADVAKNLKIIQGK